MPTALVVDDDARTAAAVASLAEQQGFATRTAESLGEAREALEERPDVLLCDLVLPDGRGTDLLRELEGDPRTVTIFITGNASTDSAVAALRGGARDYFQKPVDVERLKGLLAELHRSASLAEEVASLRRELRELGRFGQMIGTSRAMQEVYDLIEKVGPTSAAVLLVGESGTGKELAARTIHDLSQRARAPFLGVNCSAFAAGLLESELFGHEKGSFTGATRRHEGVFERARAGTLLLDEITEMPMELQTKLLRVLESQTFRRVGGDKDIETDARIIAATNREPDEAVAEGKLRQDLLYRLNVFPIRLPALRQRGADIRMLASAFLDRLNREHGESKRFSEQALDLLEDHDWPGNVRELQNVVSRAFILADRTLEASTLPASITGERGPEGPNLHVRVGSSIAAVEKRLILATLDQLDGNKKRTAATLGISVKTLYNRLKRYEAESSEAGGEPAGPASE